ncbi:MAG: FAD binding domain-containing protein [Spirochaetaceae bacterium]|nr:FAD binding domain-containing protein [Spirochaetaceae bacterium]
MRVSEIHAPSSLAEVLEQRRRLPEAAFYAGGTELLREQAGRFLRLPPEIISLGAVPELRQVALTERFVEIGAAVTLAEILELRENAVPELLAVALRGVATPAIRNLATLGGNLATRSRFMDSWPALACLDALAEFRDASGSHWVNVNRIADAEGLPAPPAGALLSRVRIPLERWDAIAIRKVGLRDYPAAETAVFALAARAEKGILSEFRLAFAGERSLRLREVEARILGRRLPLNAKERRSFSGDYREAASSLPPGLKQQFGTLVDGALDLLSR